MTGCGQLLFCWSLQLLPMTVGDQNTLGAPNFLRKKYMCIQPKISKAYLFGINIFMRSVFTFNIFVAKFGDNLKNNSKAVTNKDLSCDSLGISKMPKHEKSQHQNNEDKKAHAKQALPGANLDASKK